MKRTYLINDDFFRNDFPADLLFNTKKFYSVVDLEQRTSLVDFLGKPLSEAVFNYAVNPNGQECGDLKDLFFEVQHLLVYFTALSLNDLSDDTKPNMAEAIKNKLEFYKGNIRDIINNSDCLKSIADSEGSQAGDSYNGLPTYFWK